MSLNTSRDKKLPRKIGIFCPHTNGWLGGSKYIRMLAYSLGRACRAAGIELHILTEGNGLSQSYPDVKITPLAAPRYSPGEARVRQLFGLPKKSALLATARQHDISVVLPISDLSFRSGELKTIGWIPDFQHVYLPDFFSPATREYRNAMFRLVAERCTLVMLSSENALEHFVAFAPAEARRARVVSFPSLFGFELPGGDIRATREKFRIPPKFALVANQFWRHKNHEIVIEAVSRLRRRGVRVPIVMTGLPVDYRDPVNENLSRTLQGIASAGLADDVTVLGMVSDSDFTDLMRAAAVVIQPSRFEGWSTVVQECKALGRPLICSDIPIHREQAREALGFFRWDRADQLADLLEASWPRLAPGPDPVREKSALASEREFGRRHGERLVSLCAEALTT